MNAFTGPRLNQLGGPSQEDEGVLESVLKTVGKVTDQACGFQTQAFRCILESCMAMGGSLTPPRPIASIPPIRLHDFGFDCSVFVSRAVLNGSAVRLWTPQCCTSTSKSHHRPTHPGLVLSALMKHERQEEWPVACHKNL